MFSVPFCASLVKFFYKTRISVTKETNQKIKFVIGCIIYTQWKSKSKLAADSIWGWQGEADVVWRDFRRVLGIKKTWENTCFLANLLT